MHDNNKIEAKGASEESQANEDAGVSSSSGLVHEFNSKVSPLGPLFPLIRHSFFISPHLSQQAAPVVLFTFHGEVSTVDLSKAHTKR